MGCGKSSESSNAVEVVSSVLPKDPSSGHTPPENDADVEVVNVFRSLYKLGDEIGGGAYSSVKLATHRSTRVKYAVKCINRIKIPPEDEICLRQEVEILKSIKHPNIVIFYEMYEETRHFYLVMELLGGGELFDRILAKTCYNEKDARDLILNLLNAIKYLHDNGIVHRDLKPENLLLKSKDDDSSVKLADFGFAARDNGEFKLTEQCGTPGYIAPDILKKENYGAPVDMWSLGVITFIILGGYPPFQDDNERHLFKKIKKGEYEFHDEFWCAVSEEAKDLIRRLLTVDARARLTAAEALEHSWLKREGSELATRKLDANLDQFKMYARTRKFKAAVRTVIAANRFSTSFQRRSSLSSATSASPSIVNMESVDMSLCESVSTEVNRNSMDISHVGSMDLRHMLSEESTSYAPSRALSDSFGSLNFNSPSVVSSVSQDAAGGDTDFDLLIPPPLSSEPPEALFASTLDNPSPIRPMSISSVHVSCSSLDQFPSTPEPDRSIQDEVNQSMDEDPSVPPLPTVESVVVVTAGTRETPRRISQFLPSPLTVTSPLLADSNDKMSRGVGDQSSSGANEHNCE